MSHPDCIFCKIAAGEIPSTKIYEDDHVLAFLDIGPLSDGHTLVIPKAHYQFTHECPPEQLGYVMTAAGRIAGAVAKTVDADGYNILNNNGRAAGQLVDHVHFHIIPRKDGDGVFNRWPAKSYPEGRAGDLAQAIRCELDKV